MRSVHNSGARRLAAVLVTAATVAALLIAPPSTSAEPAGALGAAPLNDAFNAATPLTGASGDVIGTNKGATLQARAGEPNHGGTASHSVWWTFVAPGSGTLKLNLARSRFHAVLAIYEGRRVGALRQVAVQRYGDLSKQPSITLQAIEGTTYRIAVDGEGAATGAIKLAYRFRSADSVTASSCARWAAADGDDSNSGATKDDAKRTVRGLARVLEPGQVGCLVGGDVIDGTGGFGIIDEGGIPWNPITIRSEPGAPRSTLRGFFQVAENVSDLVLQDVAIETPVGANSTLLFVWGDRITLRDSTLSNPRNICLAVGRGQVDGGGQTRIAADDVLIYDNRIIGCAAERDADVSSGWHGMYVQEGTRIRVLHNVVALNKYRGIQLYPNPRNAEVAFNVFDRNGTNVNIGSLNDGTRKYWARNADVHHNILTNATLFDPPKNQANLSSTGIFLAGTDYGNEVHHNCSYFSDAGLNADPSRHLVGNGHTAFANTIGQDPDYADAETFDYRLAPGSPCVGKGPLSIQPGEPTGEIEFLGPYTDNYKACFNANPNDYEERTWFPVSGIEVDGVTFTRPFVAGNEFVPVATGLTLNGDDGSTAVLKADPSPPSTARIDGQIRSYQANFGYLGYVTSRAALQANPLHVEFMLEQGGEVVATGDADYVYDPNLADDPPGTPEHNGPAGRWTIDGVPTQTDYEVSPYAC